VYTEFDTVTVAVTVETTGGGGEVHDAEAEAVVEALASPAEAIALLLNASKVFPSKGALALKTIPDAQCIGGPCC